QVRSQFRRAKIIARRGPIGDNRLPVKFCLRGIGAMSGTRISQGVLSGLLFTAALLADQPASPPAPPPGAKPVVAEPGTSRLMRLHLMEGSVVAGRLSTETVTVETAFGKLEVPVSSIISFTPGLDSHPEERRKIGRLIQQLGSNNAVER